MSGKLKQRRIILNKVKPGYSNSPSQALQTIFTPKDYPKGRHMSLDSCVMPDSSSKLFLALT